MDPGHSSREGISICTLEFIYQADVPYLLQDSCQIHSLPKNAVNEYENMAGGKLRVLAPSEFSGRLRHLQGVTGTRHLLKMIGVMLHATWRPIVSNSRPRGSLWRKGSWREGRKTGQDDLRHVLNAGCLDEVQKESKADFQDM